MISKYTCLMHKKEIEAMGGDLDAFANKCGYANFETLKSKMANADNQRKLIPCPLHKWNWVYFDECCEYHCQYWTGEKKTPSVEISRGNHKNVTTKSRGEICHK